MKIRVDVDCTPEEARRFLGLPDVSPLNEAFVAEIQHKMQRALKDMDAESLMKSWLSATMPGGAMPGGGGAGGGGAGSGGASGFGDWGDLQRRFWSQMFGAAGQAGGAGGTSGADETDSDSDPKPRGGGKRRDDD